jgi:hypothetical protein
MHLTELSLRIDSRDADAATNAEHHNSRVFALMALSMDDWKEEIKHGQRRGKFPQLKYENEMTTLCVAFKRDSFLRLAQIILMPQKYLPNNNTDPNRVAWDLLHMEESTTLSKAVEKLRKTLEINGLALKKKTTNEQAWDMIEVFLHNVSTNRHFPSDIDITF